MIIKNYSKKNEKNYNGGCSCGELRYRILDDPIFTHACHCTLCQKYTSSAFILHSAIETLNFSIQTGTLINSKGPSGSGSLHEVFRCSKCLDQIYSQFNFVKNNKVLILKTTTLDDPNLFPPQAHIFIENKLNWVKLNDDIPKFKKMYNREEIYSLESLKRRRLAEA
tara:strand:- start:517 stop:1017 length:501 start_codon:yes stop_codon:yes gene_type:complete